MSIPVKTIHTPSSTTLSCSTGHAHEVRIVLVQTLNPALVLEGLSERDKSVLEKHDSFCHMTEMFLLRATARGIPFSLMKEVVEQAKRNSTAVVIDLESLFLRGLNYKQAEKLFYEHGFQRSENDPDLLFFFPKGKGADVSIS